MLWLLRTYELVPIARRLAGRFGIKTRSRIDQNAQSRTPRHGIY
jgi:hypothetical protein